MSNASRTLLMDLNTLQWDDKTLLEAMNIPRQMLPAICPSSGVLGTVKCEDESRRTGAHWFCVCAVGGVLLRGT